MKRTMLKMFGSAFARPHSPDARPSADGVGARAIRHSDPESTWRTTTIVALAEHYNRPTPPQVRNVVVPSKSLHMCYSVSASAGSFIAGSVSAALAWMYAGRLRQPLVKEYRFILAAWMFVNLMQLSDLLSWVQINSHGQEAPWNGALAFVLNIGQPVATAIAVSAAHGALAPSVAITTTVFVAAAVYVAASTELTVKPVAPSPRLSYSWWNGSRGTALACMYFVTMGAITWQVTEPLRTTMFAMGLVTFAVSHLVLANEGVPGASASVWCFLAASAGPAAVGVAATDWAHRLPWVR